MSWEGITRRVGGSIIPRVRKLLDNRHKALCPFPCDPMELYDGMWTEEQREAMALLRGVRGLLHTSRMFVITNLAIETYISRSVTVHLPVELSMPPFHTIGLVDLPPMTQRVVRDWAIAWWATKQEGDQLIKRIEHVARECSTVGQLVRVWPDIGQFLDAYALQLIERSKARSPYPKGMMEQYADEDWIGKKRLKEQYRPEAFEPFTAMIAECLMLPVIEESHIAIVQ